MPVKPKYLHVERSRGMLEAEVAGEQLVARAWWTATRDGNSVVVFPRLTVYPSNFLYAAIHWDSRSLIATAFNRTNELAEQSLLHELHRRGWFLEQGASGVKRRWFRANGSPGYLESTIADNGPLSMRVWWDADDDEDAVIFQRLASYPDNYLYLAVHWRSCAIVGTAFADTDKRARRAVLEDIERRGWRFSG